MAKANKSNKSEVSNVFVIALMSAIEQLNTMPSAPVFNGEGIRAAFMASNLPEPFIANALREAEKKHTEEHGDTSGASIDTVINALMGVEGVDPEALLKRVKSIVNGPRKERVTLTDVQISDIKDAYRARRVKGEQASVIIANLATLYKVSDGTITNHTKEVAAELRAATVTA